MRGVIRLIKFDTGNNKNKFSSEEFILINKCSVEVVTKKLFT